VNWEAYFAKFWKSILVRKANMIAMVIFVATYFSLLPVLRGFVGLGIFLLAYSSIYYYNDLLDYERDKTRAYMPPDKLLYHGSATQRDYVHLLAWIPVVGISAAFIYSPLLGIVTAVTILANHLRTIIKNLFAREFLLAVVEFLNFEAFWVALYGSLIPGFAIPLFGVYSFAYALSHAVYKLRSKPLLQVLRTWWVWVLAVAVLVNAAFSLPLVAKSTLHAIAILVASAAYILLVVLSASRYLHEDLESGMQRIFRAHDVGLTLATLIFMAIGVAMVYVHIPTAPLPVSPPANLGFALHAIDQYQQRILAYLL